MVHGATKSWMRLTDLIFFKFMVLILAQVSYMNINEF